MFIQPWDAALDDTEWQTWIAHGHDFGILSVNGLLGHAPIVVPTHFTVDDTTLLVHLARPNPVWKTIEVDLSPALGTAGWLTIRAQSVGGDHVLWGKSAEVVF